ncbi:hypothetical protein CDT98_19240 [Cronobacter sakazakii]|nr:hypothetical protein CDT98_19240 [Cronobacter sakazakii]
MTNEQLTDNLKLLASAFKLSRHDVAAIVCEGEIKVSPIHANVDLKPSLLLKSCYIPFIQSCV